MIKQHWSSEKQHFDQTSMFHFFSKSPIDTTSNQDWQITYFCQQGRNRFLSASKDWSLKIFCFKWESVFKLWTCAQHTPKPTWCGQGSKVSSLLQDALRTTDLDYWIQHCSAPNHKWLVIDWLQWLPSFIGWKLPCLMAVESINKCSSINSVFMLWLMLHMNIN